MHTLCPGRVYLLLSLASTYVTAQSITQGTFTILSLYTQPGCPLTDNPITFTPTASNGNCTDVDGVYGIEFQQLGAGCNVQYFMKKEFPSDSFAKGAQLHVCNDFNGGLIESLHVVDCDYALPTSTSSASTSASVSINPVASSTTTGSTSTSAANASGLTGTQLGLAIGFPLASLLVAIITLIWSIYSTRSKRDNARDNPIAMEDLGFTMRRIYAGLDRLDPHVRTGHRRI